MENVIIQNKLECKICLSTYRLFYVEDTGDFFYRKGALQRAKTYKAGATHLSKFANWHSGRLQEMGGPASDEDNALKENGTNSEADKDKGKEKEGTTQEGTSLSVHDTADKMDVENKVEEAGGDAHEHAKIVKIKEEQAEEAKEV